MKINHEENFLNFAMLEICLLRRESLPSAEQCTLQIQCHYLWHKVQELLLFADVPGAEPVSCDAAIICCAKDMSH